MACLSSCTELPRTAEVIKRVLGYTLNYPGATRWNSLYDSITRIVEVKDKVPDLFNKLDIANHFKESELQYLIDYLAVVKPIAIALDILQRQDNVFFLGYILPCLVSIYTKFCRMQAEQTAQSAGPILNFCKTGLIERFQKYFELTKPEAQEAVLAAFTLPQFKLKWITNFQVFVENTSARDFSDFITRLIVETAIK
ncbi:transposase-related [Holotrichia oblita]|uniref:Transposase-related n=1 Tax=Holotrichia oblita TaxID=644536 RepID=A0ACB9SGG4_HOLOL|nr:transposase-related [Holotrichia oblita]